MNAISELIKKPVVIGVVGFILGLFIGWFAIGWGLWPVKWVDATPSQLRADLKEDYMRMAIDSYMARPDGALAKARFDELGEEAGSILQDIGNNPGTQNPVLITAFSEVVQGEAIPLPETAIEEEAAEVPTELIEEEQEEATTTTIGSRITKLIIPLVCVVLSGVIIAAGVFLFLRSRRGGVGASPIESAPVQPEVREEEWTSVPKSADTPMVQFMASYKLGDDLFDDSFSIDSPAGEFLGECGVGISEPIGVGEPKKVTAFEAWLFDKNDIQTVTKVLMSSHAYSDDATRQRLAAKGEPIMAEPGVETILETQTLRLVARVVDMGYGDGSMPPDSFFDRFILELAVWSKI